MDILFIIIMVILVIFVIVTFVHMYNNLVGLKPREKQLCANRCST